MQKGYYDAPKSILGRILTIVSVPQYANGISYYALLQKLLVYGSVLLSDMNDALESKHFFYWDKNTNWIYPK